MKRLLSKLNEKRAMAKTQSWRKSLTVWWEGIHFPVVSVCLDCVQMAPPSTRVSKNPGVFEDLFSSFSFSPPPRSSLRHSQQPGGLYRVATNVILGFITDSQFHVLYLRLPISEMGMVMQESNETWRTSGGEFCRSCVCMRTHTHTVSD